MLFQLVALLLTRLSKLELYLSDLTFLPGLSWYSHFSHLYVYIVCHYNELNGTTERYGLHPNTWNL